LNVNKAREVASWLDSLGTTVAPDDRAALSADLSDLYVSATHYQSMLDRLLAARTTERETTVELLGETVSELRHAGDHIRSAVKRLDRLAITLDEAD
jgi:hypothetical protein